MDDIHSHISQLQHISHLHIQYEIVSIYGSKFAQTQIYLQSIPASICQICEAGHRWNNCPFTLDIHYISFGGKNVEIVQVE